VSVRRPGGLEARFRATIDRLLPRGSRGLVAVSGGGDSVALLHLLARAAPPRGLGLHVAHLDHGLRRGSTADRRFVEQLAARVGLPCHAARRRVDEERRRDESPEEAARRVRHAFLNDIAATIGAEWIALGHTLEDQAETMLLRLARGGGPRALAGMAERGPGRLVRPLLGVEREALRDWMRAERLAWREDPSNRSRRFDRNRLRRLVLPALAEATNPRAAANLVASLSRLAADLGHLDALAEAAAGGLAAVDRRGRPALDAARLAALPRPVASRVVRLWLLGAGADPRRVGSRHVAALLDLASGGRGRRVDLPGRLAGRRARDGRLVLDRRRPELE
jgi:tRNA(Ile)-lysidine synthase